MATYLAKSKGRHKRTIANIDQALCDRLRDLIEKEKYSLEEGAHKVGIAYSTAINIAARKFSYDDYFRTYVLAARRAYQRKVSGKNLKKKFVVDQSALDRIKFMVQELGMTYKQIGSMLGCSTSVIRDAKSSNYDIKSYKADLAKRRLLYSEKVSRTSQAPLEQEEAVTEAPSENPAETEPHRIGTDEEEAVEIKNELKMFAHVFPYHKGKGTFGGSSFILVGVDHNNNVFRFDVESGGNWEQISVTE